HDVGIDLLDVVQAFQGVEQLLHLGRVVAGELGFVQGLHDDAFDLGLESGRLESFAYRRIVGGRTDDLDDAFIVGGDILGARFEGGFHHRVLGRARREYELAAMLEHEGYRAFLSEVAAILGKGVPDFGHRAGAIVGHAVDDDRRTAYAIAFVADFFIIGAIGAADPALDGPLDVVFGHIGVGGLVPGHAQPRIAVGVGAACPRRDGDLTDDLGPELAPLGVLAPLAVLDVGPLTVSRHNVPEGDVRKTGILPCLRVLGPGNEGPHTTCAARNTLVPLFLRPGERAMPDPIVVAQNAQAKLTLLPALANRHGCITGATGTGKTVTLQVLAEAFSRIGTPVFMADIKADLTGISQAGASSPKLQERLKTIGVPEPVWGASPA